MKFIKCPNCKGTGKIPDQKALGAEYRGLRLKTDLSLRTVARRMGISAMHLSDLERGNRNWKDYHKLSFMRVLGEYWTQE